MQQRPAPLFTHDAPVAQFDLEPPLLPASELARRELPDVTGLLVMIVVTLGLFIVPVGATLMQGPAIVAGMLSR